MNIVVSNVKGGVGKTTSAVYLAAVAARVGRGPVLLVDADPQGSTAEWYDADPMEGVELVEGPSVRTVTKAMNQGEGLVVVDTPPGEGTVVQAALARADAVVIPTRAGGVEPNRVMVTLEMTPRNVPAGVVICSARLGTNDLEATIGMVDGAEGAGVGDRARTGLHRQRPGGRAVERGPGALRARF